MILTETRSHDQHRPLKVSPDKETMKALLKESITNLCRENLRVCILKLRRTTVYPKQKF